MRPTSQSLASQCIRFRPLHNEPTITAKRDARALGLCSHVNACGEVVGAQLVGGVRQGTRGIGQVLRPGVEHRHVRLDPRGAPLGAVQDGLDHEEHVASVLHGHLLLRGGGSVSDGVDTDLVGRVRVGVGDVRGVVGELQHRHQQQPQQFGVGLQEHRAGGEDDIHRLHVSVGADLLEEVPHHPLGVPPDELGCRQRLTVGECRDLRVLLPSRCGVILLERGVERGTLRHHRRHLLGGGRESLRHSGPGPGPESRELLPVVGHSLHRVVPSQHGTLRNLSGAHLAEALHHGRRGKVVVAFPRARVVERRRQSGTEHEGGTLLLCRPAPAKC
eukprot:Hpha_TRINITY_DN9444_c0_g1::TRINITY_DN9444_c0_g1_i2::g.139182::m.139182